MKIYYLNQVFFKSSGYDLCNDKFVQSLLSGSLNIYPVINDCFEYYNPVISQINEIDNLCDLRPFAYQLSVKSSFVSNILYSNFELWSKMKLNLSIRNHLIK